MPHIHDRQGRKIGMLGADVSLEWLRERHHRVDDDNHKIYEKDFEEQSYSFIIDNDGTYLIHPNEERVLNEKIQDVVAMTPDTLDDAMVRKMLNGESGTAQVMNDNTASWVFYSFVKYADWTVVIVVPEEIIFHKGNVLSTITLAILFVGLLLIYFLCHGIIKRSARPLTRFVQETTASQVALEQELRIASDIQQRMLPKVYPPFPDRTDIDIYGEVVTAKKVGGDLFDFFIRDEKLYFSIGDVAGKGVLAALVMAVARSMFRSASMTHTSPKLIVESINRSVCQSNDSFMFVTLFMGVLDLATGRLLYTNAGHEPPVLVGGAHTRFLNVNNNIPLGLRPDWEYNEQKSLVDKGTTLFLYTDGYTEAETIDHEQFGRERMCKESLRLCKELSPEKRAERMAVIYHRMGDNDKAYEQMAQFKKINDSIVLVSHGNVVASCYVQMNNERLKLEQKLLEEENAKLKRIFLYTLIAVIVVFLAFVLWQHHRRIKRLEEENAKLDKARKKAEKAFDMKNEFINNITNELRAPLNPIEGFSDILATKEYELQPEEREELSNMIKDSSKTITKLIDEMAELSLYESKKSLPLNYTISPNHICRHMVDALRPKCKEGVRMYFETDLSDNYEVLTNMEAIETLLRHLIENAIQYTDHGVITVACSEFEDKIRTSVTDTGKGISPERREHVFETFREMGENQKLQGLGLSICKAVTKLLGGKIWLDEDYHEGSRFIFELPKDL